MNVSHSAACEVFDESHIRGIRAKFKKIPMKIQKRTVTPENMKFLGYVVISIDITEDNQGIVSKIQLWCSEGPLASALSAVSHRDDLRIKDYAENQGILAALLEAGIVEINKNFNVELMV